MTGSDLLCEGVRSLLRSATGRVPAVGLGVVRGAEAAPLEVIYVDAYGATAYRARRDDVLDALRPEQTGIRRLAAADLAARASGLVASRVLHAGLPPHVHTQARAQQIVALPAPAAERLTLFVALSTAEPLSPEESTVLESLAARVGEFTRPLAEACDEVDLLRRLEAVEQLLPAFFHEHDAAGIYARLSAIPRDVLRFDFAALGILSGDLERVDVYTRTVPDAPFPESGPMPFPRVQTEAWLYRLIDDLPLHPVESDQPAVEAGGRTSIRVAVRVDDALLGALNFTSRDAAPYTAVDLAVARRIAEYAGLALSHQRLAEQARRAARTRAEKSDLIDEELASVLESGDLQSAFDRVSSLVQKVLPHDALLLALRQSDGRRAKVYASRTPPSRPFPTTIDVPPRLVGDPHWAFDLVADLQAAADQQHLWTTQNGYRATLRLPIRLDDDFIGSLSFLSFTPAQYGVADVPLGKRVADRVALAFARERGALLLKRADEAIGRAAKLEARLRAVVEELDVRAGCRTVVGESKGWRHVLAQATRAADTDETVLLAGEVGTGKEVVARFMHRSSARASGPFVAVNCAALPEQILEADLFGHERGGGTAHGPVSGQLDQAAGGTLFLDEVAELGPSSQAKVLQLLEQREFQRLGGAQIFRTDARILAATTHDLAKAVADGDFRVDLYERLNACVIHLPPLRERRDDIVPLSDALLAEIGRGIGRPPSDLSRDARALLADYAWPGNVRELRNVLERAAILSGGGVITAAHLALDVATKLTPSFVANVAAAGGGVGASSPGDLHSMERVMIEQALHSSRFNKSKAAKVLGLTRQQLYVRLRKYGLE